MKPIATGAIRRGGRALSADAWSLLRAARLSISEYGRVNPVLLDPPISPHLAIRLARRRMPFRGLRTRLYNMERRYGLVIVEGIGGVATPLSDRVTWSDFMASFKNPVTILVCAPRVGTLNHTLLSIEYLSRRGVTCGFLAISNYRDSDLHHRQNRRELARWTGLPVVVCRRGSGRLTGCMHEACRRVGLLESVSWRRPPKCR
ncbi:MAG: hypothetical protein A3G34_11580 [Candidatus Lindowbacteria bacterium RIFCSPLOWO2_12_FULL_62_27]|nr:MAG: hypothetical protein A3G34_11580 [Candidatus Lindowbacteria bacterium RIFCSPLOWO2_12_FULL_62_27]